MHSIQNNLSRLDSKYDTRRNIVMHIVSNLDEQQQQTVESKSFTSKFAAILHNNQSRTIEWQYKEWKTRLDHISVLS